MNDIHHNWIKDLSNNPPEGVPLTRTNYQGDPYPITEGDRVDGEVVHNENGNYMFQCMDCVHYWNLEGRLGGDWGACSNPESQYNRQVVFEHWTCKQHEYGANGVNNTSYWGLEPEEMVEIAKMNSKIQKMVEESMEREEE